MSGRGVQRGFLRGRLELTWVGGERGIPSINADIQDGTEATRVTADPDSEVLGTHASTDDVTHNPEGGLTMQTDGAADDQIFVVPHQDANQSPWNYITWGTDQETRFECRVETPVDVTTGVQFVVGLKTDLDMTLNDVNLVVFNYNTDDSDLTWGVVAKVGSGTATDTDTGVPCTPATTYIFVIDFDAAGVAHCYINDQLVAEIDYAGSVADLKPIVALQSHTATTDELVLVERKIGRNYA